MRIPKKKKRKEHRAASTPEGCTGAAHSVYQPLWPLLSQLRPNLPLFLMSTLVQSTKITQDISTKLSSTTGFSESLSLSVSHTWRTVENCLFLAVCFQDASDGDKDEDQYPGEVEEG
jgi:hypothetical protein